MSDYTENPEKSSDAETLPEEVEVVEVVVEPEVVVEKKKHADPVAVSSEDIENSLPTPAGPAVVGLGEKDAVKVSSIIFKNEYARKSLSVHHLQRRLSEVGFVDAAKDKDGYFGDYTRRALRLFQQSAGLDPDGEVSLATLNKLFDGDPNVIVEP